jgi:hypothetical protein
MAELPKKCPKKKWCPKEREGLDKYLFILQNTDGQL